MSPFTRRSRRLHRDAGRKACTTASGAKRGAGFSSLSWMSRSSNGVTPCELLAKKAGIEIPR